MALEDRPVWRSDGLSPRARKWIIWAVVLTILGIWGAVAQAHKQDQIDDLKRHGYVDTGKDVTKTECREQGGYVEGYVCIVP